MSAGDPVELAAATPDDCRAVAELHVASWRVAYAEILPADYLAGLSVDKREASWRQVLAEARSEVLLARRGDAVLGFASFGPSRDTDAPPARGEVWAIYVHPDAWSAGVGRRLLDAARERLVAAGQSSISLWVLAANARAIRFYAAAGFAIEPGSEKEFELGGVRVREVRMVAELTGPATRAR
jgi:ribosomal protein S18 acetylase RimI-like enzyme